MSITIEIPSEIEARLSAAWGGSDERLARHVLETVAVEGYTQGLVSPHEVGLLLGLNYWETHDFLKQKEAYQPYTIEDLEADRRTLQKLFSGVPSGK